MNEILKQEAGELLFGACKEIKEKLALTYVCMEYPHRHFY